MGGGDGAKSSSSQEEWAKFTPAEKQRLYQLRKADNERLRSGGGQHHSSVSEAGTKRSLDTDHDNDDDLTNDSMRNRNNDALKKTPPSGRQAGFKTEK